MSILINGIDMPEEGRLTLQISADGAVYVVNSCSIASETYTTDAVPVPPHGRLIDAEKIYDAVEQRYRISSGIEHRYERELLDLICAAPTIIEAEEAE